MGFSGSWNAPRQSGKTLAPIHLKGLFGAGYATSWGGPGGEAKKGTRSKELRPALEPDSYFSR